MSGGHGACLYKSRQTTNDGRRCWPKHRQCRCCLRSSSRACEWWLNITVWETEGDKEPQQQLDALHCMDGPRTALCSSRAGGKGWRQGSGAPPGGLDPEKTVGDPSARHREALRLPAYSRDGAASSHSSALG